MRSTSTSAPRAAPGRGGSGPAAATERGVLGHVARAAALGVALTLVAAALLTYGLYVRRIGYPFFALSDTVKYYQYASAMAGGLRPYVDFPAEYPPLAFPLFSLAGAPPLGLEAYSHRFAALMFAVTALCGGVAAATAARLWPEGRRAHAAAAAFAVAVLAAGAIVANRYDAAVALVVAAAVLLLVERRHWPAALVLGIGFALKLVPAVLLPLVLILAADRRAIAWAGLAFAATAAAPFAPYLPQGAAGLAEVFLFHGARPLQVESVLATPFFAASLAGGPAVPIARGFGSQYVALDTADAIARASPAIALAALGAAYLAIWRRRAALRSRPEAVPVAVTAVLLAFLASGKVLSPQFFVWLLPCVALVLPRRAALGAAVLACLALAQVEFPAMYVSLLRGGKLAALVLVLRNLVLLAAFALAVREVWRLDDGRAASR